jgi:glutaredoxin-like YruB-family protein
MTQAAAVTVYTTPTCPWCGRAKDFLRKENVPFEERDVSVDAQAAREMISRTRQQGVPVIADDHEAIVGFDLPRLQRMAARHRRGPSLGLRVADAKDGPGAYVGSIREGSPGEHAGILPGDVVEELSGRPVSSAADLEQISARRPPGQPTSMTVRRGAERKTLILR